ncbi:MAG: hypothetical protein WCF66_10575 [Pseudolabrys sp.]
MLSALKCEGDLDGLANQLSTATALTPDLIHNVIVNSCTNLPVLKKAEKVANFDRLVEVGAWCDAVLALIEIEFPAWSVRRIAYEDGEWFCSLTREPNLPAALDDTADGNHQALPLAILGAFLEVRRRMSAVRDTGSPTVPQVRPTSGYAICCDNFA